MIKVATRGKKVGKCNICGDEEPLTEDHTPPKGSIRISQVEMHHIVELLSASEMVGKGRISQNGVKYRTLCARCNNDLLGGRYDPNFINFVNKTGQYLKSSLHLPPVMTVTEKPQRIMRSLIGHFLAQGVDGYDKGKHTEEFREYILNESINLPSFLKIYYWVYPFNKQLLVRDWVMSPYS